MSKLEDPFYRFSFISPPVLVEPIDSIPHPREK